MAPIPDLFPVQRCLRKHEASDSQPRDPGIGLFLLRDRQDVDDERSICRLYGVDSKVEGINSKDSQPDCQGGVLASIGSAKLRCGQN